MPKKKRTYRRKPVRRRNPSTRRKRTVRRAARAVSRSFLGLNFKTALANVPYCQLGMFAAKWAAKRFDPDATEADRDSWNWSSYMKGALGGVAAGMLANTMRRGAGQKVLEGALNLMVYKAVQNELIPQSDWAMNQFGQDDDYTPDEYLLTGEDDSPMMYGADGELYPADDDYRMLPEVSMGQSAMEPIGPLGASNLEPLGPLGQDPWMDAFIS